VTTTRAKDIQRARQSDWERRERRRRMMTGSLWGAAALVFVAVIGYLIWQEARPIPRTGQDIPLQGASHIPVGQAHEPYNSDPPTSGPHYADPAQAGFYDLAPADEYLVHSLEHGYVIIWYNCSALSDSACGQLKSQVKGAMGSAGNSQITGTPKLIAVPRLSMATELALTSWGRLDTFDRFDRQRILDFIHVFRDKAPEIQAQ
jgi:hypothetical protein